LIGLKLKEKDDRVRRNELSKTRRAGTAVACVLAFTADFATQIEWMQLKCCPCE